MLDKFNKLVFTQVNSFMWRVFSKVYYCYWVIVAIASCRVFVSQQRILLLNLKAARDLRLRLLWFACRVWWTFYLWLEELQTNFAIKTLWDNTTGNNTLWVDLNGHNSSWSRVLISLFKLKSNSFVFFRFSTFIGVFFIWKYIIEVQLSLSILFRLNLRQCDPLLLKI